MKDKLKTLKDLKCDDECADQRSWELKEEAIKWIKLCEREKKKAFNKPDFYCIDAQINWIKYFFNITEEDLQ